MNSHPKSDETKALMKISAQRRASDPEWIKKMQEVAKKCWRDPEYRAKKMSEKRTDETKQRMSEAQKKSWEKRHSNV